MIATQAHHHAPDTGLLRPLTRELQVLVWSKQLLPTRFDDYRAVCMLSHALDGLRQAKAALRLRPGLACGHVHSALYTLCLGCLYLHGLRPIGKEGQKELIIQWALEHLQVPAAQRVHALRARHLWLTTLTAHPEGAEPQNVAELIATTEHSLTRARQVFANWFM